MTSNTSSVTDSGWKSWQIALAIGAPTVLGLAGIWYLKNKSSGVNDGKKLKGDNSRNVPSKSNDTKNTRTKETKTETKPTEEVLQYILIFLVYSVFFYDFT
jgi:hypothetical protein